MSTSDAKLPVIESLDYTLEGAMTQEVSQAAQCCVIRDGSVVHASSHGRDHNDELTTLESLFDVASVTKIAATTLIAAIFVEEQSLDLEKSVKHYLPLFSGENLNLVTIYDLLAHRSGLPDWRPFFVLAMNDPQTSELFPRRSDRRDLFDRSRELVIEGLRQTPISWNRGQRLYSDLGFILLGLVLEHIANQPLDELCHELIYEPTGLKSTGFLPLRERSELSFTPGQRQILPTGTTRPREPAPGQESAYQVPSQEDRPDPGEVDDDNAYAMGGVAGHAGLFTTATDLAKLGWLIYEELEGSDRLEAGNALRTFVLPDLRTTGSRRALGFDLPAKQDSAAGRLIGRAGPRGAIGHLGFTGCSLWIDLDRNLSISLLTNRTYPSRRNVEGIRALRPAFHDAVVESLEGQLLEPMAQDTIPDHPRYKTPSPN